MMLCGEIEAWVYNYFGSVTALDSTEESLKASMKHFGKARIIYNLLNIKEGAKVMENKIANVKVDLANCKGDESSAIDALEIVRDLYDLNVESCGLISELSIRSGLDYVTQLIDAQQGIKAERLVSNLATNCLRVHGPVHKLTTRAHKTLDQCKSGYTFLLSDNKIYQALWYKNDGEMCVVTGPIQNPRHVDDEKVYRIESNIAVPARYCPVTWHGLVSTSHLNCKLGKVVDRR